MFKRAQKKGRQKSFMQWERLLIFNYITRLYLRRVYKSLDKIICNIQISLHQYVPERKIMWTRVLDPYHISFVFLLSLLSPLNFFIMIGGIFMDSSSKMLAASVLSTRSAFLHKTSDISGSLMACNRSEIKDQWESCSNLSASRTCSPLQRAVFEKLSIKWF